jgi:cytochrome c oxidase subunit 4
MKSNPAAKRILFTLSALLALLALTIGSAFANLGPFNTIASMAISITKAGLIILFFMEIRERSPVIKVALVMGFFFLGIMFALSLSDFMTRGWK